MTEQTVLERRFLALSKENARLRAALDAPLITAAPDLLRELRTSWCPSGGWNGMPKRLEGCCTVQDCLDHNVCGCASGEAVKKAEGH